MYSFRAFRSDAGHPNRIYTFYRKTFVYVTEIYQYLLSCYVPVMPMLVAGISFLRIHHTSVLANTAQCRYTGLCLVCHSMSKLCRWDVLSFSLVRNFWKLEIGGGYFAFQLCARGWDTLTQFELSTAKPFIFTPTNENGLRAYKYPKRTVLKSGHQSQNPHH